MNEQMMNWLQRHDKCKRSEAEWTAFTNKNNLHYVSPTIEQNFVLSRFKIFIQAWFGEFFSSDFFLFEKNSWNHTGIKIWTRL